MCSARGCLIIWTSLIFAAATTLLVLHILEYKDKGFHTAYSIIALVYVSTVVVLNLLVLLGALGKVRSFLSFAHFFIGIILFLSIAVAITWLVIKIINERHLFKDMSAGDIVIWIGFMALVFVILMVIPCIQLCTLSATMRELAHGQTTQSGDSSE